MQEDIVRRVGYPLREGCYTIRGAARGSCGGGTSIDVDMNDGGVPWIGPLELLKDPWMASRVNQVSWSPG